MSTLTRQQPKRRMDNRFVDALGIAFDDHRLWLPDSVADWPNVKSVKDKYVMLLWRSEHENDPCWWCDRSTWGEPGSRTAGELHHIVRTDYPFSYAWLCAGCHRITGEAVKADSLGQMLGLKWYHDYENLSWYHLAITYGKHLPELEAKP